MAIKTTREQIEEVQAALTEIQTVMTAIISTSHSYTVGDRRKDVRTVIFRSGVMRKSPEINTQVQSQNIHHTFRYLQFSDRLIIKQS